jgi:hypothetical protein
MKAVVVLICLVLFPFFAYSQGTPPFTRIYPYYSAGISFSLSPTRVGAMFEYIRPDSYGAFFTLRSSFNAPNKDYVYDNISADKARYTYNDSPQGTITAYTDFIGGVNHDFSNYLRGGVGIILTQEMNYHKFYDKYQILGDNGGYYSQEELVNHYGLYLYVAKQVSESVNLQAGYSAASVSSFDLGLLWSIDY